MIARTKDVYLISNAVAPYPERFEEFDATTWVEENIAIADEDGNVILFQNEYPGVVQGHYFLTTARGRQAINLTREAFELLFNQFNIQTIFGLPLVENKKTKWMCRQVGFTSYGTVDTPQGLCEMFILHRKDYKWAA